MNTIKNILIKLIDNDLILQRDNYIYYLSPIIKQYNKILTKKKKGKNRHTKHKNKSQQNKMIHNKYI